MTVTRASTWSVLRLAGLVWALVHPPLLSNGSVGTAVAVAKWRIVGRFATGEACELQRANDSGAILGALAPGADDPGTRAARQIATNSRCIQLPPSPPPH